MSGTSLTGVIEKSLDNWEDRIIETEKGIVRLPPVGERGALLFGQDGADLVAEGLERGRHLHFN